MDGEGDRDLGGREAKPTESLGCLSDLSLVRWKEGEKRAQIGRAHV